MVNGYTQPLVDLPLFKPFSSNNSYSVCRNLIEKNLISIKLCHHNNVSEDDITQISIIISEVCQYYIEKKQI